MRILTPAALARDPDVDLVVIAVKVPQHKQLIDAALDAGKMVFLRMAVRQWAGRGRGIGRPRHVSWACVPLSDYKARSSPVIRYLSAT